MNSRQDSTRRPANGLAEEVVRTFGVVRLRAFGTSMVPAVLPGDLVRVQRADLHEISPGEIVLFSQKDRWFIHRVVNRSVPTVAGVSNEPHLITRGDRLQYDDPPVSSGELLGRVISIERGNEPAAAVAYPAVSNPLMMRILRNSDMATYLYVRLALWLRSLSARRASCQA
jgi:signal peptidase I